MEERGAEGPCARGPAGTGSWGTQTRAQERARGADAESSESTASRRPARPVSTASRRPARPDPFSGRATGTETELRIFVIMR